MRIISWRRSFFALAFCVSLALALTTATSKAAGGPILITAVWYDGYVTNEPDEGIEIMNVSGASVDLSGWQISDNEGTVTFPAGTTLAAGARLWLGKQAAAFKSTWGFNPNFEYGGDTDPSVPQMTGTAPTLANTGDEVIVKDNTAAIKDVLVYKAGSTAQSGWSGASVVNYDVFPMNPSEQVYFRKLDEVTGYPSPDTDTEADWMTSKTCGAALYGPVRGCDLFGKKVMTPGWNLGILRNSQAPTDHWVTKKTTENATYSVFVAPDHLYEQFVSAINAATSTIYIETYEFTHPDLANAIKARMAAGVTVKFLMEGEVCCVSTPNQENLWAAKQVEDAAAGQQVWFMSNAAPHEDRYNNQHAKFMIVDNTWLVTGTENLKCSGMPSDNKANGTAGNRGYYVKTNAPQVISHYLAVFNLDLDLNQSDIVPYGTSPYIWDGITVPANCADGTVYAPVKPNPLTVTQTLNYEIVQCPENCLHYDEALINMVRRAGAGDVVLVEQAYERKYWGSSTTSSPTIDPNPRLEAYIEAARRGAKVRILFDAEFDDPASPVNNTAAVAYVNSFTGPGMDISARLVDTSGGIGPAGGGIHAKIVAVRKPATNQGWVHIGSINGSENSSKFNREMALQTDSHDAFCYIYDVFNNDWMYSGGGNLNSSCTPTATPTPTNTPTPTPTFTPTPTRTPTPTPTNTPVPASTGFLNPAANAANTSDGDKNGFEVSPANAHANDSVFAVDNNSGSGNQTSCTSNKKDKHNYYNYSVMIPGSPTIRGIEVRLDAKVDATAGAPLMCVQLSWNGGASWTTAKTTTTLTTTEATYILASSSDTWGRAWTVADFSNANFRVRVIDVASDQTRDFSLDWVALNVHY